MHALLLDPGGISTSGHGRREEPSETPNVSSHATTADHASFRLLSATLQRVDAAFRLYESVGSHVEVISGLNHTACTLAVYAPQRELPHHHVRLASGWWPALAGRDWLPAGSHSKVSVPILTTSSLTRLPWRTICKHPRRASGILGFSSDSKLTVLLFHRRKRELPRRATRKPRWPSCRDRGFVL